MVDLPQLSSDVKYFDGDVGFADDIRAVKHLSSVFKLGFVSMVFCTSGNLSITINSERYDVSANDGLLIDIQSVVSDIAHDADFKCKIICMSFNEGVSYLNNGVFEVFMQMREKPVIHFSEEEMELMSKYYELAHFKMDHKWMGVTAHESIRMILRAYLTDMVNSIKQRSPQTASSGSDIMRQGDKIFRQFVLLLANNEGIHRSVKDYADRLCVSPKYLSSICRYKEGKTARELISISTTKHIKEMLLYSPLSIKEIANKMGFDNLSFFGKYVKKKLGASPNNYRKLHGYGH